MKKYGLLFLICFFLSPMAFGQTLLEADGPGDTYELISSVLAPGYDPVEEPDCNHMSFGRHIDEVFDSTLNKFVFRFHMHKFPDNDRCIKFDRQRNEIKTYDKSPDSLLAVVGEKIRYQWKFKLDSTFQPSSSFTHLHQIKAVGGSESSMPQITLTARKKTPEKLELRYAESTSQVTAYDAELEPFKGHWVEATETITFGEVGVGQYEIVITKISSGDTLFQYADQSIRMWKTNASFQRPKWGIYRSLNDSTSLKDEMVLFADFSIEELDNPAMSLEDDFWETIGVPVFPNPADDYLIFSDWVMAHCDGFTVYNFYGQEVLSGKLEAPKVSVSPLEPGLYFVSFSREGLRTQAFKTMVE